MSDSAVVILVLAVIAALMIWGRRAGGSGRPEAALRRICHGNDEQAERLIAGEMARASGITRAEAARRAVERHRRDNR